MKAALIVIDMQKGFISKHSPLCIAGAEETVPNCARLIAHCRNSNIPVFFVTRQYRSDGSDVEHTRYDAWLHGGRPLSEGCPDEISGEMPEEFALCERDYYITKPRFSAFFQTPLDLMLRRLGIDTVILTGTTTPNCIRTSCYDAISLEYNALVISDCTSSSSPEIQAANILDMKNVGAQIMSSEELIGGKELIDNAARISLQVLAGRAVILNSD